jgi:predicted metal-dependent hydrolase
MDNITITRSMRRKTITIQIEPDGSVTVSAPYFCTNRQIQKFLQEKQEWITHHQQLMLARKSQQTAADEYLFLGKAYKLELRMRQKSLIEVSDKLYVAANNKKYVRNYLISWYRQQARKIIVERVQLYAKRAGLHFASVGITEAETRWGSCSQDKRLHFNWKLIMAPLEVIDYVIAHELAHLTEMNHSADFWETVRKINPVYRQCRTWLKRYGHTLRV